MIPVLLSVQSSLTNAALTTVGYVSWVVWWYFAKGISPLLYIFSISLPLFLISILLTALFLHLDKLPCCNPREQLSVYDPDQNKRLIMVDGEVVDDPDDEEEETVKVSRLNFYLLITPC